MKRNFVLTLLAGLMVLVLGSVTRPGTTAASMDKGLPDIKPERLKGLPRTIAVDTVHGRGADLTFYWNYSNLGLQDAHGFDVNFYIQSIDDARPSSQMQEILHRRIDNAPPGKAKKRKESIHVPLEMYKGDGEYLIITEIDSKNEVKEKNEDNNVSVTSVFLTADMPDLEMLGAIHAPEVKAGGKLVVSWSYRNRGTIRAKPTTAIVLLRSLRKPHAGVWKLGERKISGLGPLVEDYREEDVFVIPKEIPEGEYDLVWRIDDGNSIEESIEENEWVSGNGPILVRR